MMWLKCCPKCNGDLYEEKDVYGPYIACIQCGHYLTVSEEVDVKYSLLAATVLATRGETPLQTVSGDSHHHTEYLSA